jgi:hypothetical protein
MADPLGLGGNFISKGLVAPVTTKKKKDFWTDQMSTVGSMGGAAAGAMGGAAIGSVVPVVGTAIGGLLGAILGGAAGGAGGQVLENSVAGDNLGTDVGSQALWGGLTSVGPLKALSIGKGLIKGTGEALLKGGGSAAIKAGVEKGIAATPIRDAISKMTGNSSKLGDKLIASQSLLTGAQARAMKINPIQTIGNINTRTGLTNISDMADFGKRLTGNGDTSLLDTMSNSAIADAKNVSVDGLREEASKLIDAAGASLKPTQRKALLDHAMKASVAMRGGADGGLSPYVDPTAAIGQANNFKRIASTLTSGFNVTGDQAEMGNIYNSLARKIEDAVYSSPGTNANITAIARSGRDDLLFMAQDLEKAGNTAQAQAARKVAEEVGNVKSVKELRSLKKDFVDLSKIDRASAQADGARSLTGKDMTKTVGSIVRNPLNIIAMPLDAATPTIGGMLKKVDSAVAPRLGATGSATITPVNAALRSGMYQAPFNTGSPDTTAPTDPNIIDMTQQPDGTYGTGATDPTATDTTASNPYGVSSQQVGQLMMMALAKGDNKAATELKSIYDLVSASETSAASKINTTTQKALNSSANGEDALARLEASYKAAGGGQGPIGGYASGLLGSIGLNSNAKVYNDTVASTAAQLARAMGETGVLSDTDIKRYMSMLPTLQDTTQSAASKLALIRQALTTTKANATEYRSGSTDLASQLGL